jgi:type IV pilus assembly protein PilN
MRLTINLATRIYLNMRRLNLIVAAALAVLGILLLLNLYLIVTGVRDKERLKGEIAQLEGKEKSEKSAEIPEKDYQALIGRIRFANGIIERKTLDWLSLLDKLEGVVPEGVAITSVQPSPKEGNLKLSGVARNFGALRKFVETLEESGEFTGVYLLSHSEVEGPQGEKGTGFNISCKAKFI